MDRTQPRMPYGYAKRIVAALRVGDVVTVRPAYLVPLHNAARRLGVRLTSLAAAIDGQPCFRVMLRAEGWTTGHQVHGPRRDEASGRWLRGRAAA
jgi:hypothetical protein